MTTTELTPEQIAMQEQAQAESEARVAEQLAQVEGGEGETTEAKAKRGTPTYEVQAVDGLPEQKRGTLNVRDRATIYVPLLTQVASQPGQWFAIANYTSLTGARSAAKAVAESIADGTIPVQGGTFEFETRRRVNGDSDSVLYSRFVVAGTDQA